MTEARKRVRLLFGGRSAEHEVSRLSAANVLRALDPDLYEVIPIGINRDGRWLLCEGNNHVGAGTSLDIPAEASQIALAPGGAGDVIFLDTTAARSGSPLRLDLVFPVLHGPNGKDGTVQGLLDLAGVPYVGSSVTGSAACMDKDVCKRLLRDAGIPVVPFLTITDRSRVDWATAVSALEASSLFLKPANLGSSIGVSRAETAKEFDQACDQAFRHDRKVLIEKGVARAREIECAVVEHASGEIRSSAPGEIMPMGEHGFYTYDAKYLDPNGAVVSIPADLSPNQAGRVRELAVKAFQVLGCAGLARVDFFVGQGRDDVLFVNEVNTMPGFTAISLYPKMWEADGFSQRELTEVLISHTFARHERRNALAGA